MSKPLSYIELSKDNLIHNFKELKKLAKRGTKFSVAVKGNAYGHGLEEVVKILDPYADYFQVNSIEELEAVRKITKKKVLLLGYVAEEDLARTVKLGCILSVFSLEQLSKISAIAEKFDKKQEIHLPIDAHLGREGFLIDDLPGFFLALEDCKKIKLTGIYAHFANIEDTNNFTHAKRQIDRYLKAIKISSQFGHKKLQTHISATSGLLVYEKGKGINPLVRLGIGVYGMWPSEHIKFLYKNKLELCPVLAWKTKVAQVKTLPPGSTIGYGLTYMTHEKTKIAVIPQGYADGFDRGLSNKAEVLIKGKRCKILGRVAMNMFVVNVSHSPETSEGDEVALLGKQGNETITPEEMAEKIDTINYEITTRISPLLSRIVV